ncbi:hypothetical protein DFJ43DRAFT_326826 [Lentinula guzmanii]|uniref:Uncharacterized protein n=1 Tax=Lentinula guzmanii TaxID=2804957 RepID=A0AA38JKV2_9AGAR|nr:hypothetical protein DFJ43DRAFT_326826 [Lentinula guzmanii]
MPHRIADAAHIAPYLTNRIISHHDQPPEIGKENAGRRRQTKSKKKTASKQDNSFTRGREPNRNYNSNIISRSSCNHNEETRRNEFLHPAQQGRIQEVRYSDGTGIPDYPPPTFQEAMSSPPLSVCPSTTTLGIYNSPGRAMQSYDPPENFPALRSYVNYDSDSDESLEVIEVHRDITQRGEAYQDDEFGIEGRRRALLDDHDPPTPVTSTQSKRRHMSLSPLRLFAHKPIALQERALSAQSASPYSFHRNASFFRSTTSLKTVSAGSFFRLPLSAPSSTSLVKAERKATTKGKERTIEPLQAWEVLEPPTSLMSAVESLTVPPSPDSGSPSPVQTHFFTFNHNPSSDVVLGEPRSHGLASWQAASPSRRPHSQNVLSRQRPSLYVSPNVHDPNVVNISLPASGILQNPGTSPPSPSSAPRRMTPSFPLSSQSRGARHPNLLDPQMANPLQLALETPLPPTPVDSTAGRESIDDRSQNGGHVYFAPDVNEASLSLSIDTAKGDTMKTLPHSSSRVTPIDRNKASSIMPCHTDHTSDPQTEKPIPGRLQIAFPSILSSSGPTTSHASARTPTRRHYAGRPLPKTPQSVPSLEATRHIVDSLYAPNPEASKTDSCIGLTFPDGLLIDLDESTPTHCTLRSEMNSPTYTDEVSTCGQNRATTGESTLIGTLVDSKLPESLGASSLRTPDSLHSNFTGLEVSCLGQKESKIRGQSSYDALSLLSEFMPPDEDTKLCHSKDTEVTVKSPPLGLADLILTQ